VKKGGHPERSEGPRAIRETRFNRKLLLAIGL
jgi:hypothetical protein